MAQILELKARDRVKSNLSQTTYYLKIGNYERVRDLIHEALRSLEDAENHKKAGT